MGQMLQKYKILCLKKGPVGCSIFYIVKIFGGKTEISWEMCGKWEILFI